MWTIKKEWFIFYFTVWNNAYILFTIWELGIKDFLVQYNISNVGQAFVGVQGNII